MILCGPNNYNFAFPDHAFYEEASKILNKNCSKASDQMNVSVFKIGLSEFHNHPSSSEATRLMTIKPFILRAIGSTQTIAFDQQLWEKIVSFLDMLVSLDDNDNYQTSCNDIIEFLDGCFQCLPLEMYQSMGDSLGKICKESERVAKNDKNHPDVIQNALQIFQKSFYGICRFQNLKYIQTISNHYLERSDSSGTQREILIDAELSKIVCGTLSSLELAGDAAIELFPSLCKLMNSDDSSLRKESAKLMSSVNVSALMHRVNDAEGQLKAESELPQIKENLQSEISRAENAEKQVDELTQINVQLMREVEQLRADKEKLERQVAVLSEGSAYM